MRMKFFLYQSQLNVTIVPLNDRMPFLVTKNPSMVVVRGQSKSINRDMLEVEDPDTDPVDIRFNILDNGLQGKLVYADQTSRTITTFSQQDVNDEKVFYIHDGASSQTQFYFSATDGRFQPRETGLSRHFRIHVIPLTLELRNKTTISLDQGTTTAIITNKNMGAFSNGDRKQTKYRLIEKPKAGKLLVEDKQTNIFLQVNVDREEFVYMQTDMTFSNDSFIAEITNLDKRIIRTSRTREKRSMRDREVWDFTHEDLKNGVIYFVCSANNLAKNTSDKLSYRLEAPGVQPANGIFSFMVVQSFFTQWQPQPNVTPTAVAPIHVATRKDVVIATSVVASILLIIVSAILIVKCRKEKYHSQALRSNG